MFARGCISYLYMSLVWYVGIMSPAQVVAQRASQTANSFVNLSLPSKLRGYILQDSILSSSPSHGMIYHYADDSVSMLTVSISRLRSDIAHLPSIEISHRILQIHATKYADSLPLGVTEGAYDTYKIAYSQTADTTIHQMSIPGYTLSVAVRSHGTMGIRFLYWYLVHGWLVQVRAVMPEAEMATSTLPLFVNDLIGNLVHQVSVSQQH